MQTGRIWKGEDLGGQSILLCSEQGLGDAIQFARYAPLVAQRGAEVLLCCPPRLTRLLERLPGVARVIPKDTPWPRTDRVCLLMDVPGILGTDLDSIPDRCPYLFSRTGSRRLLPVDAGAQHRDPTRSGEVEERHPVPRRGRTVVATSSDRGARTG